MGYPWFSWFMETHRVNSLYFLMVFFAVIWIIFTIVYWLTTPSCLTKNDALEIKNRLEKNRLANNKIFRVLYYIIYAHQLIPAKGTLAAIFIIYFLGKLI